MLSHLPDQAQEKLLTALNKPWESNLTPAIWKREMKVPILKQGKDPKNPGSYRPISLTSSICKLFERMVNHRLVWFLETNNFLSPQQSGYRKNKSTMDSLSQLVDHIRKGFQDKRHTTAVFDMEKAYDTVWRKEILNSLHRMGLRGRLINFIENFLSNREFCVRVGASHSDTHEIKEGLPQGSVISGTCFAIAINDIVKQVSPEVQCTLYVDDFTIFISARNESLSNRALQLSINKIAKWTKSKGLKLSTEKSVAVKFEQRKKGNEPTLTLQGSPIRSQDSTRYLGLIMDKRLNWRLHVEHLRTSCTPAINLLKHLSHLSWGADRTTLKHLYTALVQSRLDYDAHLYGVPSSGALLRLNPIQNACLRACTGAFKSSPAVSLCTEAGVLPLDYRRDIISLRFLYKTLSQPKSLTFGKLIEDHQDNPKPFFEHTQHLLQQFQLPSPNLAPLVFPESPPWMNPAVKLCPFTESSKKSKHPEELRSDFLAHCDDHHTASIYTDGSKMENRVGYATVFPKGRLRHAIKCAINKRWDCERPFLKNGSLS